MKGPTNLINNDSLEISFHTNIKLLQTVM